MSMKKIILSAVAVAAFGTFAMAQTNQPPQRQGMPGGEPGRGQGMGRPGGFGGDGPAGGRMMPGGGINFERLNLTDAQKQRIQALLDSNQKSWETNRAQFEEMGKLMQLKRQGLLTTEQGTRLTSLQAQMKTNGEKFHNDILAVLTAEQKTLLEQMRNERPGGGRERGGMRDGRMMPPPPNGGGMQQPPPNN